MDPVIILSCILLLARRFVFLYDYATPLLFSVMSHTTHTHTFSLFKYSIFMMWFGLNATSSHSFLPYFPSSRLCENLFFMLSWRILCATMTFRQVFFCDMMSSIFLYAVLFCFISFCFSFFLRSCWGSEYCTLVNVVIYCHVLCCWKM